MLAIVGISCVVGFLVYFGLSFLLILPRIFGVNGVFLVGFFAEICVVILSVILLKKCLRF
ncbi:hypothetical protein [Helicobacter sp. 23-1045]